MDPGYNILIMHLTIYWINKFYWDTMQIAIRCYSTGENYFRRESKQKTIAVVERYRSLNCYSVVCSVAIHFVLGSKFYWIYFGRYCHWRTCYWTIVNKYSFVCVKGGYVETRYWLEGARVDHGDEIEFCCWGRWDFRVFYLEEDCVIEAVDFTCPIFTNLWSVGWFCIDLNLFGNF